MDALKGFHQNVLTPKSKKLLRIITHCCIYEYLRMPFGLKNSSYYRQHLNDFAILSKSLYRICDQQTVFEMTQARFEAYEKIRKALTEAPLLLMPDWHIPFSLYIDACGDELGEALHQGQIIDDKATERPVCYISRQIKPTEARYGASQIW
ncbi:hypothetical protein O181_068607 [Austropuccinia psidii MF-1]|uniref:Reverse transcriptase/retrotransposon-derived protein RNase H-like domain-containing protein n=1 Tax=Austropuccinia psidii MF-1 TaxID=1389203 RepID=A0A9Q3EZM6_9BASI|nr:hypothetical protein [Austropuccinia psidii MF-1]